MIGYLLKEKFKSSLSRAYPQEGQEVDPDLIEVTKSTQEKFGHYQCNGAMKLSKLLKQNPREIAQALCDHFEGEMVQSLSIAGPGFINITLTTKFLEEQLHTLLTSPLLGVEPVTPSQKIIIDYSSPNVAKEMHVGHLRSTIIGEALARVFEFLGHDVLRLNHIGDWGTAFGMLIAYLKETHPEVLHTETPCTLTQLVQWYREAKEKFDKEAEFKKRSQLEVVALQSGQPQAKKAWEVVCEISRKAYEEVYHLLDLSLVERGESFYNPLLEEVVKDLETKGLVELSEGAKCIYLPGYTNREGDPLPLMIQKSDGGYNYASTDLAAVRHRFNDEKAQRVIYVTDAGQATHFKMIFEASQRAGYWNTKEHQVDHVPFGLVLRSDGKKFRTRSGDTERLIDLLYQAIERATTLLEERGFEGETLKETGSALGIGAVKYADLSCHRTGDYVFSYEKMLSFEGNTAAFLMYSFVRILSIQRKVGKDLSRLIGKSPITLSHPSEVTLALTLSQFPEAIHLTARDLLPNRLCDYLFTLAEKFNAFFRDCRVEGVEEEDSRLLLCEATARILSKGFSLLGIQSVNKM